MNEELKKAVAELVNDVLIWNFTYSLLGLIVCVLVFLLSAWLFLKSESILEVSAEKKERIKAEKERALADKEAGKDWCFHSSRKLTTSVEFDAIMAASETIETEREAKLFASRFFSSIVCFIAFFAATTFPRAVLSLSY